MVAVVFALVPATRTPSRILTGAFGTFAEWLAWNFTLHVAHSANFDTNAPLIKISWADAGSGVLTFVVVALALGLWIDRQQPASRVIAMAAMAGILASLVDLFVL